jgi:protein involved in polysaccharide export with SLBB domain
MYSLGFTIYDCRAIRKVARLLALALLGGTLAGCNNKFWDPSQIGRFRPTPAVNVILDSLGVAEETPAAWENAEEPQPGDVVATRTDYALQPGDLVRISIFELMQEGVALVNDYVVSETGKLSIPEVGVIQAAGLTETQLEDEIKHVLSPDILRTPSVTVMLVSSQQRTFAVLGNGVSRPNRYVIPRYDFRLLDALATAQAQMQFNVSYVYVSRKEEGAGKTLEGPNDQQMPELDLIQPQGSLSRPQPIPTQPLSGGPGTVEGMPGSLFGPSVPAGPTFGPAAQRPSWPGAQRLPGATSGQRDIPEPSEPARKFETEREMFDLIAPHATAAPPVLRPAPASPPGNWLSGGKAVGVPTPGTLAKKDDISASVLAYGFRPLVPSNSTRRLETPRPYGLPVAPEEPQRAPSQGTIVSPTEFGTGGPAAAPVASGSNDRVEWIFKDNAWIPVPVAGGQGLAPAPAPSRSASPPAQGVSPAAPTSGAYDWVLRDGQWVTVPREQPAAPPATQLPARTTLPAPPRGPDTQRPTGSQIESPAPQKPPMELEWEQATQTRLIKIPADKLLAGEARYNIVIQPGDIIHVPVDLIGEFTIMGNVNRPGPINITGRPWTLMMAIAAAGGLGPLATPKRVEVTRRIGTKKEEIVMVDLDKIAAGEQPDFFIKPNDLINVGTDFTARWRAVLRNAFRAAYGFAFVYDRNFADIDYGTGFPWFSNF